MRWKTIGKNTGQCVSVSFITTSCWVSPSKMFVGEGVCCLVKDQARRMKWGREEEKEEGKKKEEKGEEE